MTDPDWSTFQELRNSVMGDTAWLSEKTLTAIWGGSTGQVRMKAITPVAQGLATLGIG